MNKPAGWTSFDVVNKLRGALKWKAVGHAGTLDPPATGVLIVLCGEATRRADEFMDLPKEYVAVIRFGVTTTTDDLAGDVVATAPVALESAGVVRDALKEFVGPILQVPPAVSAVKVAGRRSYKLARRGETPELAPRPVTVYAAEILNLNLPELELRVRCSKGTYIRSLARDLGHRLGWGGALASLRRTAVGPYHVERALSLGQILERSVEFAAE